MKAKDAFQAALSFREPSLKELAGQETDAYRLFCGDGEGINGLKADRMGPCAFLYRLEARCSLSLSELETLARLCLGLPGVKAVYLKDFATDRSKAAKETGNKDPKPLLGEPQAEELEIRENGHKFLVRPYDGFSTGIFLDQRDNRKALAIDACGLRALNLFSYTCGFSVYLAKAGAQVTSVDLSPRYLDWGKRNFTVNGLEAHDHEFFAADSFQFLKGAKKRGRTFDLVVLDPPSFSRDRKGGVFSIAKDARKLAEAASEVVAPGGRLFFSTNYEQWTRDEFLRQSGLGSLGIALPMPSIPKDFERQSQPLLYGAVKILTAGTAG